jgi:hypothetical protein
VWSGYDSTVLHRFGNRNRILLQRKAHKSRNTQCRTLCDEHLLSYQYDLGVNMKQVKKFEYSIDNGFMKGAFCTWNKKRVRRHLRQLLGWKLYFKVRKMITIKEVQL